MSACATVDGTVGGGQRERFVGDPIDVVTGHVTDTTRDFRLIGPLVLDWFRFYNSGQHRTARALGHGHSHAYDYRLRFDADGLLLLAPSGRRTSFPALLTDGARHDAGGLALERMTLASYRLTRPNEPALEFTFRDPARPARVGRVAAGSAEIRLHHDGGNRLVAITHSTGLEIAVEEDEAGLLRRLEGAWDGHAVRPILTCDYDGAGNLVEMTDAFARRWSFAYDAEHRMVRKTDRRGYSFFFEYDAAGRCVRSAGEDGVMGVALCYHAEERRTEVTEADGGVWQYFYDDAKAITRVVGPCGDVRRFIQDERGRTVGEIDALGHGLAYVFDRRKALVGKRFSTGRVIEVRGGVERPGPPPHREPDTPVAWEYGDLLPGLALAPAGLAAVPAAVRRLLPPDPAPLPDSPRVPPFGASAWYPEPEPGREFSVFGHLAGQRLPGGGSRRWTYDANDSMETYTDADGAVTRQERRSWNQLDRWIDPLGVATAYRWTHKEDLAAVLDGDGTLSEYAWDPLGRLTAVARGGTLRETYRYDAAGNLVEKRDAGGAVLLTLVPTADRLVAERRLASGDVHRFTYDAAGRFLTAAADAGTVCFAYDALGQRTRDARGGRGVRHAFSGRARLDETAVFDRHVVRYERDATGLTIRLPGGAWLRVERLGDRTVRRLCSNGTAELSRFDDRGRCVFRALTSERGTSPPWTRRYQYSAEGDLVAVEDTREGTTHYRYDRAHRLVGARPPRGTAEVFAYDAAGNLLEQPGLTNVRLAGANRLGAANGEVFAYDARHHVAERRGVGGRTVYTYDSRDMLVACERPDAAPWRAEYDAIGRRTRVEQGGAEQTFFWDTDRLAAETSADGRLRIYVYPDAFALTPVAFVAYPHEDAGPGGGEPFFVFSDQRGAPVLVEDAAGEPVWRAKLACYGAAAVQAARGTVLNLRFPGHYFDTATGLHYNRFRYYDPVLGRYLQSDPLGMGGGRNVYAYPSNPLVRVDVRGLHGGDGSVCADASGVAVGEDEGDAEKTDPPGPAGAPGRPRLSQEEGQAVVDGIHAALPDEKQRINRTTGLTELEDGRLVVTSSDTDHNVTPAQRDAARALLGAHGFGDDDILFQNERGNPGYTPKGDRNLEQTPDPESANHAEQRGIQAGYDQGSPATRQWASSDAEEHEGAACHGCEQAQQGHGVRNETGVVSEGGRFDQGGDNPDWNQ